MPAIIDFLGYDPLPQPNTLAEQLVRKRTGRGMSQEESARELGVDPSTLASGNAGRGSLGAGSWAVWSDSSGAAKRDGRGKNVGVGDGKFHAGSRLPIKAVNFVRNTP